MRRRASEPQDSLELLLDTICNMFGTIMFIALVAALLAMVRASGAEEDVLAGISRDRARAVEELAELAASMERQLAELPAPASEDGSISSALERVLRAEAEVVRRRELVDRYREAVASARRDLTDAAREIEPLRAEIERLEESIDSARKARQRVLRTPLEREAKRAIYTVVLWQGRLYPICDLSVRHPNRCEWLRQWHRRYVAEGEANPFRCNMGGVDVRRSIRFIDGAGIPIGDAAALRSNPEFQSLLTSLDPGVDLIGFVVADDSYDVFSAAKQVFLERGFGYCVEPAHQSARLPEFSDSWVSGIPRGL